MIPVSDARLILDDAVGPLAPKMLPLTDAVNQVLAEDVVACIDVPQFDQSAMDGYAFQLHDLEQNSWLAVAGEAAAGSSSPHVLQKGTAMRIFTGAPMPNGADVVLMQEHAHIHDGNLLFSGCPLQKGRNVRAAGSVVKKGAMVLPRGTVLLPGAVGLLASLGMAQVKVYPSPRVALLVTGNELVTPGNALQYGQVYDSNSPALIAALKQLGVDIVVVRYVSDCLHEVEEALEALLPHCDLLLITGGVSVGKYDFVIAGAKRAGVQTLFHKVAQKPGKPLFFGRWQQTPVFGLPGNPGAVLTCFYIYVAPVIKKMMQQKFALVRHMPLGIAVEKKTGLTYFLKGHIEGNKVMPLGAGDTMRKSSFAFADCIIELDADDVYFDAESIVKVHPI
ncbi:molybdopterin molybdotransferase MoeA [Pseudocnuella soli]|uniref:molybdopterin molybdotransferase MoeA n=1 Tax=Pseudocnuella soli TaxID=2502779 RepID=UPI0010499685|nr:gephyrin-like molybdotransferase Glp [Pseudocnuella soli]